MSRTALVTAAELERYPDDDGRYELVDGHVLRMSPVGFLHGRTVIQIGALLHQHLKGRHAGVVLTEVGFVLKRNPDTVRAPDIAFVRQDRLPSWAARGFLHEPPDLALEVLSPEDQGPDIRSKVSEYLAAGVTLAVVVDPDARRVTLHRRLAPAVTVAGGETVLDLDDVVPGFCCPLSALFD